MKKILVASLFLFSFICISAQDNFKDAYIVTLADDTVYGRVNQRTDIQNARSCRFSSASDFDVTTYYPGDIRAYRFVDNGKYYISKEVTIDDKTETLFLEFMVEGLMNLYYYKASEEQSYFFFENEADEMLTITRLPERVDGNNKIYADNRYIGVLRYTFKDYAPIANNADNIKYDKKSMIKVTKTYHDNVCITGEECIIYENKNPDKSGAKIVFSVYGGVQYYTFMLLKSSYYVHSSHLSYSNESWEEDPISSFAPVLGGQMNIYVPSFSRSFSLQLDFSAAYLYMDGYEITPKRKISYNTAILSPKLGVKYRYPKYKWQPVVEVGYAFTGLLDPHVADNYGYVDSSTNEFVSTYIHDYIMRNYYHGYYAGVGVDYNIKKSQAVFLRILYEGYFDDFRTLGKDDRLSSFQLKLGYTF